MMHSIIACRDTMQGRGHTDAYSLHPRDPTPIKFDTGPTSRPIRVCKQRITVRKRVRHKTRAMKAPRVSRDAAG